MTSRYYKERFENNNKKQDIQEASVVQADQIPKNLMKDIMAVAKAVTGIPVQYHSGIHGIIADIETRFSNRRLELTDLKKLAKVKSLRWFEPSEDDKTSWSVGIEGHAND